MAERHPSRTLAARAAARTSRTASTRSVSIRCFPVGDRADLRRGDRARAARQARAGAGVDRAAAPDLGPAGVLPLARRAAVRRDEFEQLVGIADRLIVDSTEWDDLPGAYAELARALRAHRRLRHRVGAHRALALAARVALAGDRGRAARSACAARARRRICSPAGCARASATTSSSRSTSTERLEGIDLDGKPAPFPPGRPPSASDVLSAELDRFTRDRIYEAAVRAASDVCNLTAVRPQRLSDAE